MKRVKKTTEKKQLTLQALESSPIYRFIKVGYLITFILALILAVGASYGVNRPYSWDIEKNVVFCDSGKKFPVDEINSDYSWKKDIYRTISPFDSNLNDLPKGTFLERNGEIIEFLPTGETKRFIFKDNFDNRKAIEKCLQPSSDGKLNLKNSNSTQGSFAIFLEKQTLKEGSWLKVFFFIIISIPITIIIFALIKAVFFYIVTGKASPPQE